MIIQASEVSVSARHEKSESSQMTYTQTMGVSTRSGEELSGQPVLLNTGQSAADLFAAFMEKQNQENKPESIMVKTENGFEFRTAQVHKTEQQEQLLTATQLFQSLMEAISLSAQQNQSAEQSSAQTASVLKVDDNNTAPVASVPDDALKQLNFKPITIEVSVTSSYSYQESESLSYNSAGSITTADGETFDFSMALDMQRSYSYSETSEFTQVTFIDPLVINYPGQAADLSEGKFSFDLDADGEEEMISYLNSGAMLALDKNEDGIINSGAELFGALSGDGFADLAAYDEDGNNYIDEADSIFDQLQLWRKTDEIDSLVSLKEADIGAIYLGAVETPFSLKDENNQQHGQVKSSSFYLTEAGGVGSVQQVDMVV